MRNAKFNAINFFFNILTTIRFFVISLHTFLLVYFFFTKDIKHKNSIDKGQNFSEIVESM